MRKMLIIFLALGIHEKSFAYPYTVTCDVTHIAFSGDGNSAVDKELRSATLTIHKTTTPYAEVASNLINTKSPILKESEDGVRLEYHDQKRTFIYYKEANWLYVEYGSDLMKINKSKPTDRFLIRNCH
ncbi:hypothetical protein WCT87_06920 [Pectobacterium brasiliense]|uniref:hypothetical protein n=1 Tax=Pectobacterium brasiliense TaxID=180957 RepID=UPI003015F950